MNSPGNRFQLNELAFKQNIDAYLVAFIGPNEKSRIVNTLALSFKNPEGNVHRFARALGILFPVSVAQ
jgi:hypothetical protein